MKKATMSIFCAALAVLLLFGCSEQSDVPAGFKLASNDACDFDFVVPSTWTVSLSDGTVAAYCSPTDPSSVSVMAGELEHADSTVDDWWASYLPDFESVYSETEVVSVTDAVLDGVKGKTFTLTGKLGENVYRFEITAAAYHSRIYMVTFTSTPELYENHTETLASVIENFKFR